MRVFALLIAVLSCSASVRAAENWVDFCHVAPFHCRSEYRLDNCQETLEELVRLKADVEKTLQLQGGESSLQLNLFKTRRNYRRYLFNRIPDAVNRRALYVKGPDGGQVFVYRSSHLQTDLRHEATHAVLHAALPYLPLWLDEGLAEYFEAPASKRVDGHPHMRSLRWAIRFGWRPRLAALDKKQDHSEMTRNDYRDAWACVHFLLNNSKQSKQVLIEYLNDINSGTPPGEFSKRLHAKIPEVNTLQRKHFKNWKR